MPLLVKEGLLSDLQGRGINDYYARKEGAGRNVALMIFAIIGSLLIGSGIILLIAHNWEFMSRPVRSVLAFMPLLIAQAIGYYAITRKRDSAAWTESVPLSISLSVCAAIAIIGQTYHIYGSMARFMLTWMVLTLPLIYLFRSTSAFVLFIAGMTGWLISARDEHLATWFFWPLIATAVPYYYEKVRTSRYATSTSLAGWALCIGLIVITAVEHGYNHSDFWLLSYCYLFAVMFMAGLHSFDDAPSAGRNPYLTIGAGGLAIFGLLCTFNDFIREFFRGDLYYGAKLCVIGPQHELVVLFIIYIMLGVLLAKCATPVRIAFAGMPLVLSMGVIMGGDAVDNWLTLVMNLYYLATGVIVIMSGIKELSVARVNGGMVMVIALIVCRFFDYDMSFMLRGIAFILIGIAFIVTNVVMSKKARKGRINEISN